MCVRDYFLASSGDFLESPSRLATPQRFKKKTPGISMLTGIHRPGWILLCCFVMFPNFSPHVFSSQHTEAKLTGCFVFKRQTRERYQTSDVTFSWNDDLSQNWLVKTLPREAWVILVNHQKDEDTFGQCLRGGKKRVLSVLLFGFRHMKSSKRKNMHKRNYKGK